MGVDWERVAAAAVDNHNASVAEAAKSRPSRIRAAAGWFSATLREVVEVVTHPAEIVRPDWYWSVQVSDWPTGKRDGDLTAEEAIQALRGLGEHFGTSSTPLANNPEE